MYFAGDHVSYLSGWMAVAVAMAAPAAAQQTDIGRVVKQDGAAGSTRRSGDTQTHGQEC
jgi:hypothetical protein